MCLDTVESGTCATAFKLFKATPQDMLVSDLKRRFLDAPPLTLEDIHLTEDEFKFHHKCITHDILDIIITHGGSEFQKYRTHLEETLPSTPLKREVHRDDIHPLPTMDINEATVKGNIEICETMFKELGYKINDPEFHQVVRLVAGDQLTIARLRAIANHRAGHESGYESFDWMVPVIGLFHLKMAQAQGILDTHMGASNSSRNPTSLAFQNTVLHQKPIPTPTPFRTARDLIRISLISRILHCLLLVSGASDMSELARQLSEHDSHAQENKSCGHSFARLEHYAQMIYKQYASNDKVYELRTQRREEKPDRLGGDMVFEDSSLFIRDALHFHEFIAAVKAGDSGRIILILKLWAFAFRANGRTKYAHEMLYLIHNLTHVWPPALR